MPHAEFIGQICSYCRDNFKKNRIFDQVQKDQKKQLSPLDIPFAVQLRHHPGVRISCTITAVQKSTQKFKTLYSLYSKKVIHLAKLIKICFFILFCYFISLFNVVLKVV